MRETAVEGALKARPAPSVDPAFEAFERASRLRGLAVALAPAARDCVKLIDLDGRVSALNPAAETLLQLDERRSAVLGEVVGLS